GTIREPPALVDRLPDRAFVQREPLRQVGPRSARRSSASSSRSTTSSCPLGSSPAGPRPAQHRAANPQPGTGRPRRRGPGLAEALDVLSTELASYWCSGGSLLARFAARNGGPRLCVVSC